MRSVLAWKIGVTDTQGTQNGRLLWEETLALWRMRLFDGIRRLGTR